MNAHALHVTVLRSASQRGMSLIAALFLIVVLAALGAFAVRISAGQQHTVDLAVLSNRALAAANAGVEFAAHRALPASGVGVCDDQSFSLSAGALSDFDVSVACTQTAHADGGTTTMIYTITSIATHGEFGQPDYVSRRVRARFTDATS